MFMMMIIQITGVVDVVMNIILRIIMIMLAIIVINIIININFHYKSSLLYYRCHYHIFFYHNYFYQHHYHYTHTIFLFFLIKDAFDWLMAINYLTADRLLMLHISQLHFWSTRMLPEDAVAPKPPQPLNYNFFVDREKKSLYLHHR